MGSATGTILTIVGWIAKSVKVTPNATHAETIEGATMTAALAPAKAPVIGGAAGAALGAGIGAARREISRG